MPDEEISFEEYQRRLDEEMAKHNEFLTADGRLDYNITGQRIRYQDGDPRFAEDFARPYFKATDWGVPPHDPLRDLLDAQDMLNNIKKRANRGVFLAKQIGEDTYLITNANPPRD